MSLVVGLVTHYFVLLVTPAWGVGTTVVIPDRDRVQAFRVMGQAWGPYHVGDAGLAGPHRRVLPIHGHQLGGFFPFVHLYGAIVGPQHEFSGLLGLKSGPVCVALVACELYQMLESVLFYRRRFQKPGDERLDSRMKAVDEDGGLVVGREVLSASISVEVYPYAEQYICLGRLRA